MLLLITDTHDRRFVFLPQILANKLGMEPDALMMQQGAPENAS